MASLADVAIDDDTTGGLDDVSDEESTDKKSAAEDVMAAINANDVDALVTALDAFVLSVK